MNDNRIISWTVRLCLAVAMATAAYLSWQSFTHGSVVGCDQIDGMDCDAVLNTRWSQWLGIPVALLGTVTYAVALAASFFTGRLRGFFRPLVSLAAMAAIYFIGLQAFVVGEFCLYCMIVHGCGLTAGILLLAGDLWAGRQASARIPPKPAMLGESGQWMPTPVPAMEMSHDGVSYRRRVVIFLVEVLVVLALFAGQILGKHKTHSVGQFQGELSQSLPGEDLSSAATTDQDAADVLSPDGADESAEPRKSSDSDSNASRDSQFAGLPYPVLGNPKATTQIFEFIDYTCKHCRSGQPRIEALLERYGDQLSVVVRPIAMEKQCNSLVEKDDPRHFNACKYARYALAMWVSSPESFLEFHRWLAAGEHPPGIDKVWSRATKVVDSDLLLQQVNGSVVTRRLANDHQLWEKNPGAIPMIVIGKKVLHGFPETDEELFQIVEEAFPNLAVETP